MARKHSSWMKLLAFILCWSTSVAMAQTPVTLPGLQGKLAAYGANNRVAGIAKPWVDVVADCSVPSDHTSDVTTSVNTCIANNPGATIFFPKTNATITGPDYRFISGGIHMTGSQTKLLGAGNCSMQISNCTQLLFSNIATNGVEIGLGGTCQGCAIESLEIRGSWPTALGFGGIVDNWLPCNPPANQSYSAGTVCVTAGDGLVIQTNFVTLEHVVVSRFGRHCINQDGGTVVAGDDYNFIDVSTQACHGDGYYVHGGDSNAGSTLQSHAYYNLLWGFDNISFLSSTDYSPQATNNHLAGTAVGATKAISSYACDGTVCTMNFSVPHGFNVLGGNAIVVSGTSIDGTYFVSTVTSSTQITFALASSSSGGNAGTARLTSLNEFYAASGSLGGGYYVHGANIDPVLITPYVEGGQSCDFGATTIIIGGNAASTCTDANGIQTPAWRVSQLADLAGQISMSYFNVDSKKDSNLVMTIRAGSTLSKVSEFKFIDFDATTKWWMGRGPISSIDNFVLAEASSNFEPFAQNCTANGKCRLQIIAGSHSIISAQGSGAVRLNSNPSSGTGGTEFWDGAASPAKVGSVSNAGLGTFNAGVVSPTFQATLSTPGSSSATCTAGQIWADASFVYVCTATNTIKRATLAAF